MTGRSPTTPFCAIMPPQARRPCDERSVRSTPARCNSSTIVDCDIHPAYRTPADLHPFLPARWREHMTTFGEHLRQGLSGQLAWPRMMAAGMRVDAFPEAGPPGSDLELMRRQHLDANGVEFGMLMQLSRGGMEERNLDFAAALSRAVNDWQLEDVGEAGAAAARRHRGAAGGCGFCGERDRAARRRSGLRPDPDLAALQRSARPSALLADLRGGAALPAADRAACAGLQRRPRLDRVGLADLLHAGALRHDDRHAEHASRAWCSRACSSAFPS